jgi:DnaJ-class molecular chaperone
MEHDHEHMAPGDEAPDDAESTGEDLCPECSGTGRAGDQPCPVCEGTGTVTRGVGGG